MVLYIIIPIKTTSKPDLPAAQGFNASLVAWDIYTDLLTKNQPLLYAITLGIIAFIAVEGLAVYLVGAAAKTNNGPLWFFSVIFATFFTYAHYQEITYNAGIISQYIMLAVPFFVVVGYWARTVKTDVEHKLAEIEDELAREMKKEPDSAKLKMKHGLMKWLLRLKGKMPKLS
jgi:hypothetical protein